MSAATHEQSVWMQASARGNGVGVTVLSAPSARSPLIIHILPKLWRGAGGKRLRSTPPEGGDLAVFEGDTLEFVTPWNSALSGYFGSASESDSGGTSVFDEEDTGRLDALWTRVPRPLGPVIADSTIVGSAVASLWRMLLGSGLQHQLVPSTVLPTPSSLAQLADAPELEPLVKALFVRAVADVVPRRRPAYRSHVEELSTPRGRLVPGSLATQRERGSLAVECEFDELTTDHAIWRGIKAALAACLSVPGQSEAVLACLMQLADVGHDPASSVVEPLRAAVRATRDVELRHVGNLAASILASEFHVSFPKTASTTGVLANVKFASSSLWEALLAHAFKATGCTVEQQHLLPLVFAKNSEGWASTTPKRPDLIVRTPQGAQLVVDAKYMNVPSIDQADKGDQYQAIAYAQRTGHPTILAFARPPSAPTDDDALAEAPVIRAIPPAHVSLQETRFDELTPDWSTVGSFGFVFPAPEDKAAFEHIVRRLAAQATALLDALFPARAADAS